jgi:hypothetical protein
MNAFARASTGGEIFFQAIPGSSGTFTGSRYSVGGGGTITAGVALTATSLPGSVAGTVTAGQGSMYGDDFSGDLTVAGNVQSTSGAFGSGSSTIYIRPNGTASVTGQTTISAAGDMLVSGSVSCSTNFTSGNISAVLAATGAGTVYLRPNGFGSSAGQMYVGPTGLVTLISSYASGNYNGASSTITQGNFNCKAGAVAGYGANSFGINWTTVPQLYIDSTLIGTITTTSDYRIKKDVADLPSTWEKIKALRPVSYSQAEFQPPASAETKAAMLQQAIDKHAAEKGIPVEEVDPKDMPSKPSPPPLFVNDDNEQWGFIAHEIQSALVPTAASGEKDMEDGVQSLNLASILAATVRGLQEAMTRIETLEIVTLEKAA